MVDCVTVYEIYVTLKDESQDNKTDSGMGNEDIKKKMFFGEKPEHLKPVCPFKWEGHIKAQKEGIFYDCILFEFIKVLIIKYEGSLENTRISKKEYYNNEINGKIKEAKKSYSNVKPFETIDIKWTKWNDTSNYPKNLEPDTLLYWLVLGTEAKKNITFGKKYAYEKLGICDKDGKVINFSTLQKCFISLSSKRIIIVRSPDIESNITLVPSLEVACWAAIGLVSASSLLDELDKVERELWGFFEKGGKLAKEISNQLKRLGNIFRRASLILRFHSGYPISSPVAGLTMETFSKLTGSVSMIKALREKLENAYRLYNLYQQYFYFKEMERLEED